MADILPKVKMYTFISIIAMLFQFAVSLSSFKFEITDLLKDALSGFIPFVGMINIAVAGLPLEISLLFGIITGIFSGIQTFILAMVVLSIVSNIIWSPNV